MKKSILFTMILVSVAMPGTYASAQLAVNDPLANQTLLATWAKTVAMATKISQIYTTAKGHLDSAVEVENMIKDANSTYQTLSNLDLNQIAADFKSGDVLENAGPFGTLGAIQDEVDSKVSTAGSNVDFAVSQKNRIQNLRRLGKLKMASVENMGKASTDLKERDSSQITAQSTATLAMLASIEQGEKEKKALEAEKAEKSSQKSVSSMGKIYGLMGNKE